MKKNKTICIFCGSNKVHNYNLKITNSDNLFVKLNEIAAVHCKKCNRTSMFEINGDNAMVYELKPLVEGKVIGGKNA